MLNNIGVNACARRPSLNISLHIDVEHDRVTPVFWSLLSQYINVEQDRVNACVLGPSRNLSQHADSEQDKGKRWCSEAFLNLSQHVDIEEDWGKRLCFEAFYKSPAAQRC